MLFEKPSGRDDHFLQPFGLMTTQGGTMRWATAFVTSCLLAAPWGAAQAETLADVRADIASLLSEVESLKQELELHGTGSTIPMGSVLDRVNAVETELQRLTGQTEEMDFRIRQIVKDGTNRLGDLEFRVCEADPACDIGALGTTATLGGGEAAPVPAPVIRPPQTDRAQLAVGEETDFRRAQEALASGDFRSAQAQFETFRTTYPGSPLEPEALLGQGEALEGQGDIREAARSYLEAFSGYPAHDVAPTALAKLGASLGALGKQAEACVTLGEVEGRYPGSDAVTAAQEAMAQLGCL
jgi:tol-pal system protein YbgF